MKGTPQSLWLSAANRATGWWMGTATAMMRRQQRAALAEMTKAATGVKPKRARKPRRRPATRP
ncbi:hypothetical protein [Methylobacterium planeticum]|uniref:Uncharacterized protein n=1 Tax=Methylobacterium planeticum TaxID=2615211 RepID=A0A6N6MWF6_9HYPH|nr:hypothetical protein [Methylobacterium planeticum]KAB1074274.1 hypothetical protein F6X51_07775 [Methylobacterium planeticum]